MEKDFTEIVCDLGISNITLFTITKTTGGVTSEQDWDKGEKLCLKRRSRKRSTINFKVDLETYFKFTDHPLSTSTLYNQYIMSAL